MKKTRCAMGVGWLLFMGVVAWLGAAPAAAASQENGKATMASPAEKSNPAIPVIDRSVPTVFETASFGLG